MTDLIAIDIETTGLDNSRDAIIDIGAVRFNGKRIEDEFSTLINPHRHIPEFITGLTGIDDSMVRQAPGLTEIIPELEAFVSNLPVVGHNIRFDLGFLQKIGILTTNECIDTYTLASVLMPSASRYNLGALGQQLGILLPATHRGLDDAKVTHLVYEKLYRLARELPLDILQEIVKHGEPLDWDAGYFFNHVFREKTRDGIQSKKTSNQSSRIFDQIDIEKYPPLTKVDPPRPLDEEEIASVLDYSGPFSRYFDSYEHRPEQVSMLRAISNALSFGRHTLIEAGTGVGKSFAYLVPAAYFAVLNNTRIVISTNTINLQDQLIKKDIPALKDALGLDLRASVLKGRSNYLCPRRLHNMRHFGPGNADELRVLAKVLVWGLENHSGDRNELNLTGPAERDAWLKLSAEDDACTTETCLARENGTCPFHRAKTSAQNAHILVVNHALLLSDVSTGSKVLPEYDYLIVDEAHHLESATTNALSFKLTQFDLSRTLKEVGNANSGVLGHLLSSIHAAIPPSDRAKVIQKVEHATSQAIRLDKLNQEFFSIINLFAASQREGQTQSTYAWQSRILPATRKLAEWEEVEMIWGQTSETMRLLLNSLENLYKIAGELYGDGNEELETPMGDLSNILRRMTEMHNNLTGLVLDPSSTTVYWIEVKPKDERLSLNAAPLHVGGLITEYLWNQKSAVILTSATLTTHGEFTYLRNRLGADMADDMALGSPFDYESSTLLFIGNDMPEPNQPNYDQMINRSIVSTARATGGRMLVLFTSYAALKRAAQGITAPLAREDIIVLEQGEGASANTLLESFKSTERAVLLGTKSFWEGVDIPGEALSVVVITKLPFDVPTDPLIAARSETYEDPFNEYYLPEAILKFRQGFGRLIRTQFDRGIVAILDKRVMTKQYGRLFIESVPQCTLRTAPIANLAKEAGKWLGL
jgi:DNA polymerase-3 subunit epsilon/ATP-dependent DNA helicase DinG